MKKIWVVLCEFDIGQELKAFTTVAGARAWAVEAVARQRQNGLEDTYEDLRDGGLLSFQEWELHG